MPLTITDSFYISILDTKIVASLCGEKFFVDVTPSTWIGGGNAYVRGASVKIVSPLGITLVNYTTSGYDIEPPMTGVFQFAIPTTAGSYLYGTYKVTVKLTDSDGTEYELEKLVNICVPDRKYPTRKKGCISAKFTGDCVTGKLVILLDQPPAYKGKTAESQINALTLLYPTVSGVVPLITNQGAFSVQVYEGEYKLTGTVCARYNYGDGVYFDILYDVKCTHDMKCILDECCILDKLKELNSRLLTDCTEKEKEATSSIIFDALRLLKTIEITAKCGDDPSAAITQLEELIGCSCTCNCNEGVPIINVAPSSDVLIAGCGFVTTVVGNTTVYTFSGDNFYLNTAASYSGFQISPVMIDPVNSCKRYQTITYTPPVIPTLPVGLVSNCESLNALFTIAAQPQKNTVDPTTYGLLTNDCDYISPPTGFAVSGAGRVSAFGKMEWYVTLTLANAAALESESVLIFTDTTESLIIKKNVNYIGIGFPKIADLTCPNTISSSSNRIANINVTGTSFFNGANTFIDAYGSQFLDIIIQSSTNWVGGIFASVKTSAHGTNIQGTSTVSNIYAKSPVAVLDTAVLANAVIDDRMINFLPALFLQSNGVGAHPKAYFCRVSSTNNIGAMTTVTGNGNETTMDNIEVYTNAQIAFNAIGADIGQTIKFNLSNISAISNTSIAASLGSNDNIAVSNLNTWNTNNIKGKSVSNYGINSFGASLHGCVGVSETNIGINALSSTTTRDSCIISDCMAESGGNVAIQVDKARIMGGVFISKWDNAGGHAIKIAGISPAIEYIIGTKTIVRSPLAYGLKVSGAMTGRVIHNTFLNENGTQSLGLDPLITLTAVVSDASHNIK